MKGDTLFFCFWSVLLYSCIYKLVYFQEIKLCKIINRCCGNFYIVFIEGIYVNMDGDQKIKDLQILWICFTRVDCIVLRCLSHRVVGGGNRNGIRPFVTNLCLLYITAGGISLLLGTHVTHIETMCRAHLSAMSVQCQGHN